MAVADYLIGHEYGHWRNHLWWQWVLWSAVGALSIAVPEVGFSDAVYVFLIFFPMNLFMSCSAGLIASSAFADYLYRNERYSQAVTGWLVSYSYKTYSSSYDSPIEHVYTYKTRYKVETNKQLLTCEFTFENCHEHHPCWDSKQEGRRPIGLRVLRGYPRCAKASSKVGDVGVCELFLYFLLVCCPVSSSWILWIVAPSPSYCAAVRSLVFGLMASIAFGGWCTAFIIHDDDDDTKEYQQQNQWNIATASDGSGIHGDRNTEMASSCSLTKYSSVSHDNEEAGTMDSNDDDDFKTNGLLYEGQASVRGAR